MEVLTELSQTYSAEFVLVRNQARSHPAPLISKDQLECKGGVYFLLNFYFLNSKVASRC